MGTDLFDCFSVCSFMGTAQDDEITERGDINFSGNGYCSDNGNRCGWIWSV